jgi:hypothetical protein
LITILKEIGRNKRYRMQVKVRCECGTIFICLKEHIKSGNTRSCGCLQRKTISELRKTHGESQSSPEYRMWKNIKTRCYNINDWHYSFYGKRGIKMYKPWINSYKTFLNWIIKHIGRRPSINHSIDRINNDGNYSPGNLQWATKKQQSLNQRPRCAN